MSTVPAASGCCHRSPRPYTRPVTPPSVGSNSYSFPPPAARKPLRAPAPWSLMSPSPPNPVFKTPSRMPFSSNPYETVDAGLKRQHFCRRCRRRAVLDEVAAYSRPFPRGLGFRKFRRFSLTEWSRMSQDSRCRRSRGASAGEQRPRNSRPQTHRNDEDRDVGWCLCPWFSHPVAIGSIDLCDACRLYTRLYSLWCE
jgi:hypothetical protein